MVHESTNSESGALAAAFDERLHAGHHLAGLGLGPALDAEAAGDAPEHAQREPVLDV